MGKQKQLRSADYYRALSMAYATGSELPEKRKRKKKLGTQAECRRFACQQSASTKKRNWADAMRRQMTPAEAHLWRALRKLSNSENLIEAQVVISGYIADFCCFKYRLVIEVDGPIHDQQKAYDSTRDAHLLHRGYRTLRFTNQQVLENRAQVLGMIIEAL